ncbi:MAG: hypothetical protein HZB46_05615 [Solirubrobacterales bacterium]|nr:hypothetical protein [Solirubrobacterales bacterium]
MSRPLRAVALVLTAVLALSFAACGGDDGGGDRLSKDEYIKQAEAIGQRVEKETNSLNTSNVSSPKELAPILEKLRDQISSAKDNIGDLKPPEEVQQAHDKTIESLELFLKDLDPVIAAAKANDTKKLQELTSGSFPSQAAQRANQEAEKIYKEKGYGQLAD